MIMKDISHKITWNKVKNIRLSYKSTIFYISPVYNQWNLFGNLFVYIIGIHCTNILKQKKSGLVYESSLVWDDDWYSLSRNDFLPVLRGEGEGESVDEGTWSIHIPGTCSF